MHEICIWYNSKIELNIWYRNLCLKLQRSDVSCSSWPVLHTLQQGFWPTPPYIVSRSFIFWSCRWATQSFSSLYRFSIGFRSGDWLGHSRNLKFFLRSHSLVALAVCLGSLSCWKTQPWPIFNALTEGRRLLAKIPRYMAPSNLPSIRCSRPVPFAEKHPQSMMFPPPCFTVGMVFLGLYSSFLQTWRVEFIPKSFILVSSDHMTFSHASSGSSRWSLANFRLAWTRVVTIWDFHGMIIVSEYITVLNNQNRFYFGWQMFGSMCLFKFHLSKVIK